jgi:hypothetical protein
MQIITVVNNWVGGLESERSSYDILPRFLTVAPTASLDVTVMEPFLSHFKSTQNSACSL